jgi:hypothetical protein
MEADWEFEVGPDAAGLAAPVIDALWPGFVDLRRAPELAWNLPEAAQLPALAEALAKLNAAASPVWTSKCDFWPNLEADEFDAGELDAPPGCLAHAMGCYIDLLPGSDQQWAQPAIAEAAFCAPYRSVAAAPIWSFAAPSSPRIGWTWESPPTSPLAAHLPWRRNGRLRQR